MFRLILIAAAVGILVLVLSVSGVFSHAGKPLPPKARADLVVVEKSAHRMTLYAHQHVLRVYTVSLGRGGMEPKTQQGDGLTPEGHYEIDRHNAHSAFYLSLHVNYPSAMDRKVAAARGRAPWSPRHGCGRGYARCRRRDCAGENARDRATAATAHARRGRPA